MSEAKQDTGFDEVALMAIESRKKKSVVSKRGEE